MKIERRKRLALIAVLLGAIAVGAVFAGDSRQRGTELEVKGNETMGKAESSSKISEESSRVRIRFDGEAVLVRLDESPTSRDFIKQLPLEVKFSDHARTEKIAYLPRKLDTEGAPSGFDPSVGDVTYYAPWGNLAIFYRDFDYARGLVPLGVVESGLESLAALSGEVAAVIEHIEDR